MTDQGLRDALKELRTYCGKYVDDPNAPEAEQLAYDDVAIQLSQMLAKHPAEPVGAAHRATCPTTYGEACDGYCEPVGVGDEAARNHGPAVSAIAAEFMARYKGTSTPDEFALDAAQAGLLAALPLLGTRPQPDAAPDSIRDALALLVQLKDGPRDQVYYDTRDEAWQSARDALASGAGTRPQPTLDKEALTGLVVWYRTQAEGCEQLRAANEESGADLTAIDYAARASTCASAAHYLESLVSDGAVRPLPTREQIAEAVYVSESRPNAHAPNWNDATPAVRALFYDIADAVLALMGGAER